MASPDAEVSDFAVPPWRMATFRSMLWARWSEPPLRDTTACEARRPR